MGLILPLMDVRVQDTAEEEEGEKGGGDAFRSMPGEPVQR